VLVAVPMAAAADSTIVTTTPLLAAELLALSRFAWVESRGQPQAELRAETETKCEMQRTPRSEHLLSHVLNAPCLRSCAVRVLIVVPVCTAVLVCSPCPPAHTCLSRGPTPVTCHPQLPTACSCRELSRRPGVWSSSRLSFSQCLVLLQLPSSTTATGPPLPVSDAATLPPLPLPVGSPVKLQARMKDVQRMERGSVLRSSQLLNPAPLAARQLTKGLPRPTACVLFCQAGKAGPEPLNMERRPASGRLERLAAMGWRAWWETPTGTIVNGIRDVMLHFG
jgi:hypothetical protein